MKIIFECKLEPLLNEEDPKSQNIMDNLINGKETAACDGTVEGFSSFLNIFNSLENDPYTIDSDELIQELWTEFIKVVTQDFAHNTNVDYTI